MNWNVETAYYIAIVALACVLGAEIAGIYILISRARRVRDARLSVDEPAEENEQNEESGSDVGAFAAATLLIGSIPIALQLALIVLAVAVAVGALVLVGLLLALWAKGYLLVDARDAKREGEDEGSVEALGAEEISEGVPEEEFFEEESFEEVPVAAFAEASDEAQAQEAYTEPCVAETVEETAEEAPVTVIPHEAPAAAGQVPAGIPVYSSAYPAGQAPVIEKYIKETYKEVIKETTTTTNTNSAPAGAYSPATEEILKAIAELMKLGTQLRMEKEMAVENPVAAQNESLPTFSEEGEDAEDLEEELDAEEEVTDGDETSLEGEEGDGDYESEFFSGNERIVGFDEDTGCYIVARYRKSFEAKLIQARPHVKKYYSEIKNALFGYENTRERISWTINTYTNDRTPIAKINMRNKSVDLYLALDPATLEDSVYRGRDVGDKKKYADTPYFYKVNSPRRLTLALELIQRTCEEHGLSPIDIEFVNYEEQYPFEATEELVQRGLIREYLREETPAATFELDPDHAPLLPEEDASVVPANAGFTWEFDDEQDEEAPATEEPVAETAAEAPVEETDTEEPAVEEPATEEAAAGASDTTTTTTTHESVKTTEHEYTERYYGIPGIPAEPQAIPAVAEPIEAIAEPCEAAVEEPAVEEPVEESPVEDVTEETEEIVEDAVAEADAEETVEPEEELIWETEVVEEGYEEEPEEVYEKVEETYEEEPEETYEEVEEIYEEEAEEVYEEAEEVEEEIEEEIEEEEAEEVKATPAPAPARVNDSTVALLDVCQFDGHFQDGAVINLEALKKVGLAPASALTLKVYASGPIKGQYTVEANHFTLDAIKAIGDADGDSIMIR